MKLNKFYISTDHTGTIYGKGREGVLAVETPQEHYSEKGGGYYTSLQEEDEYQAKINALEGFDTIEEAERAAKPLIERKIPFLEIGKCMSWDEATIYLSRRKYLTNERGEEEAKP